VNIAIALCSKINHIEHEYLNNQTENPSSPYPQALWHRSCGYIYFGVLYTFFKMGYLYLTNGLSIFSRSCGLLMSADGLAIYLNGLASYFRPGFPTRISDSYL
jgi:hypothetical protein